MKWRACSPGYGSRYAAAADAEVGHQGLRVIEKQLVQAGLDTEYGRDLGRLLSKLVNPAGRVERS